MSQYIQPRRFDHTEEYESNLNFIKNLFYGMWVDNEFMEGYLTCGNCGMKNLVNFRQKDNCVACPCCGYKNQVNAG